MSPEQTNDEEVDGRADLYSLAAVLYEMLAGEPPFVGRSFEAIVAKRLSAPTPSVRVLRDTVPAHVDDAIRKAMAPAPADRFATVAEFARALQMPSPSSTGSAASDPTACRSGASPSTRAGEWHCSSSSRCSSSSAERC